MNVRRAKTAGFCMGVSLARRTLDNAIRKNPGSRRICTLGPIIHNPQVLADYEALGVTCLQNFDSVTGNDIVVIRAHGITQQVEATLRASGATIIDATCPRVKKAQLSIAEATSDGSSLLLFGEADHPEVRGLISYAHSRNFVFPDLQALQELELDPAQSWVLASQTTQNASVFASIRSYLAEQLPHLTVLATICDATDERQKEARAIAADVDAMVGNYEKLEKTAWMEPWPTENPQRLARRAANHAEHTQILMGRKREEFLIPNCGDMSCCGAKSAEEFYEKLSKIPVPTLIWEGGLDPLAKVEDALKVAQTIPGASLLTYQHLGHGGADECPEMAARDCDRFFRDVEGRIL